MKSEESIIQDGQIQKEANDLKGASLAKLGTVVCRHPGNILSEKENSTGTGRQLPIDQIEERGLSGTVRPNDSQALPNLYGKRNVVYRSQPPKLFGQLLNS